MVIPRIIRRLLPAVLVLTLSACGFHLRDALVLPPDLGPVKVVSTDRYSPLAQSLARSLSQAGAVPATEQTQNPAVLELLTEQWGDTPISVDAFGRAQEFSLRYAVIFELRKADGSMLVPRQTIELARDYISIPTESLGTEGEREILVRELQREMTASVLRRIAAVSRREDAVVGDDLVDDATPTDTAPAMTAPVDDTTPLDEQPTPPDTDEGDDARDNADDGDGMQPRAPRA